MQFRLSLEAWLTGAALAGIAVLPQAAGAQGLPVVSRPVVQAMPSGDSQRLSAALTRIARDPRDISALIDAGDAAAAMGDAAAAAGFYRRADEISPANPRIKAGLGRALVLQGKPIEAIALFAEAERGGAGVDVTADRGLAYDLVGDPLTAQRYYQAALARKEDDEVRRRLGVSMAIAGDATGSDATLMPLLRKQDKPAWRAQAFALAIAGKTKEAVDTVNTILPPTLAQSVTPYLRYMPRLTKAQQAAAVNLGKFPRASEIGRDDPAIAAYVPAGPRVASADAALIPQGRALGAARSRSASAATAVPPALTASQRRARDKATRLARAEAAKAARVAPPEPMPTIARDSDGELPPLASTSAPQLRTFNTAPASTPARPVTPTPTPMPTPAQTPARASLASAPTPAPTQKPGANTSAAMSQPATPMTPLRSGLNAGTTALAAAPAPGSASVPPAAPTARLTLPAASTLASTAAPVAGASASSAAPTPAPTPGFDLARIGNRTPTPPAPASTTPLSLAQAFADLGAPSRAAVPVAGAVDVRSIEPVKPEPIAKPEVAKVDPKKPLAVKDTASAETAAETKKLADAAKAKKTDAKKPEPKKPEKKVPSHPSRIWVQIGIGRNEAAIAYDWRKFTKENAALFKGWSASISEMGRTNRILVGPFETQKAATTFVSQAKKANFDGAFVWTSPAGQVVDPLSAK